ncbi:SusD/RagB family nutrient-binding outer membrane lipoprotein [Mucilaginibacter pocheonensis]|uniref:Starch-binding associating with outer membrane n=1 Tax=Mucilaginibacter pocheonensis TaxID=398050 RepID=A0ABU1TGK5_9SPHI|nr:SusD/RagB family nutrient-binding outer membrane lipoprotein [Mucilaginibacter pocheonensis]MDR6944553.1 hypothetical protein [Mucilaginibacter pocheonensis]
MKNKNIKIKSLFVILAATSLSFGCSKINDINVSPNDPPIEKATPQVLFPSAVMSTAGQVGGELDIIGGIWSQYWTQSPIANQFKTIDSYNLQRQDFNRGYNELFAGALADYQLGITKAKEAKLYNFYLMCTVMKAYTYEVLVDLYDKVPYTEAFQGAAKLNPKFDDGFAIYKGLIAEIDAALATDYKGAPFVGSSASTDFVFGGTMDYWLKFANTLKLKMYLRMVNTHAAEAEAGIRALYAAHAQFLDTDAGVIESSDKVSYFTDVTDQRNPIYAYTVFNLGGNDLRASKTLVSWLTAHNDPRATVYFGTASPISIDQGNYTAPQSAQPSYYSATAPAFKATDPVYFLTKAESHFLQAEAGVRYGVVSAQTEFLNGVTAAFAQYSLSAPADTSYQWDNTFNSASTARKIKRIIYQKWASFPNSHALEGFFDQQRTGYPEISDVYSTNPLYTEDTRIDPLHPINHSGQWVYSKNGVTGGRFPKRLVFPDSERSRNSSTPAEVPITTPVWWGLPNK